MDILRAAVYLRKSRSDDPTLSVAEVLGKHRDLLLQCAADRGIPVSHIYEEVVTGESIFGRPQMIQLLKDVEAGRWQAVLCVDLDRLGRGGMQDQGLILDTFRQAGTLIITPDHTYNLAEETDEELAEFKTFFSRREYKMIRKRMARGVEISLSQGAYLSTKAPYGYRKIRQGRLPTLEIDETEAQVVRQIFQLYLQGMPCSQIAATLTAMGIPSPEGARYWYRNTVYTILHNLAYTGKVYRHRSRVINATPTQRRQVVQNPMEEWEVYQGLHPAILSEETFQAVQTRFQQQPAPATVRGKTTRNVLAGLVRCAKCGRMMLRYESKGRARLVCPSKGCTPGSYLETVEEALLNRLREELHAISVPQGRQDQGRVDLLATQLTAADRELEKLQGQRDRLHDLLEQGVYTIQVFHARMQTLSQRLDAAQAARDRLQGDLTAAKGKDTSTLAKKIASVLDAYDTSDIPQRNQLLKSVVASCTYSKSHGAGPDEFLLTVIFRDFFL